MEVPKTGTLRFVSIGLLVAAGFVGLVLFVRHGEKEKQTHAIYNAWYVDSAAPAIVVEQQTFEGPTSSHDPRRDSDAKTTFLYHTHRLADGAWLGTFTREGWTIPTAGVWKERAWACDRQGEPMLIAVDGMKPVADRHAIRSAIATQTGGDFEMRGRCYVDGYTGYLAVHGADGKVHWVTTDLRHVARTSNAVYPAAWYCSAGQSALIEPRLARCFAPADGPANQLLLSRHSALAKDRSEPEVLSAVSATNGGVTRVLWSRSLTELSGKPDPLFVGASSIAPGRALVLVRSDRLRVHVLELNLLDGAVTSEKVLFDAVAPGNPKL